MFSLWFPYVALCFPYGLDVLLSKMLKEKRKEVPMQGGPQRSPRGNVVACGGRKAKGGLQGKLAVVKSWLRKPPKEQI